MRAIATASAIDIARQHRMPKGFRRRDREHAGAGADVQHSPRTLRLGNPIQCQQAAARRSVMAGAEGKRRLDLDADAVRRNPRAVVRAMHREPAGLDRL